MSPEQAQQLVAVLHTIATSLGVIAWTLIAAVIFKIIGLFDR